jgi:hypothetical protein
MDKVDVPKLLAALREQVPAGTPIKLQPAFDLFLHTLAEMLSEDGGGRRAAEIANRGMVSAVQSMGYRIVIDGSEFERVAVAVAA